MTHSFQLNELGALGAELGNGKQGIIYALPRHPNFVFKRYKNQNHVDEVTLTALIDWSLNLPPAEKVLIENMTAWPSALIYENGAVVGIMMPRAPTRFTYERPDGTRVPTILSLA